MAYPKVVTQPVPAPVPRLLGRRALVTAAESPIGAAVVALLTREGASVTAVRGVPADVAAADSLVDDVVRRLGGLDLVVVVPESSRSDIAAAPLDQVLRRNIYPLYWITQASRRYLAPGSAIVTTDIVEGLGRRASIAEAKAGIETVTMSLAQQLEPDGVRVNGVAPREPGADAAHVAAAYLDAATGGMTGQMLVA